MSEDRFFKFGVTIIGLMMVLLLLIIASAYPCFGAETQPVMRSVDRNVMESGEGLCSQVAEWAGPARYFAGHEGNEDVITCRWWKLGKVGEEPVVVWKCKDGNSKWAILCGNDRWWTGDLD